MVPVEVVERLEDTPGRELEARLYSRHPRAGHRLVDRRGGIACLRFIAESRAAMEGYREAMFDVILERHGRSFHGLLGDLNNPADTHKIDSQLKRKLQKMARRPLPKKAST